jgi:V/A-type H+-transporting ATPase subunit C
LPKNFLKLPKIGESGYSYTNIRVKYRKDLLLKPEIFQKLMKMSKLSEIISYLEQTVYKKEIDELRTKFSDINLIEYALNRNLEGTFQKILNFSLERAREQIKLYLRRYDVANIKTIIRGKSSKVSDEKIINELIACGEFTRDFLEQVVRNSKDINEAIESFKETEYYDVLKKNNDLSKLEDELDKFYYKKMLKLAEGELKKYIRSEIWVKNTLNKLRCQKAGIKVELISGERREKINIALKENNIETRVFLKKLLISKCLKMIDRFNTNVRYLLGYLVAKENEINNIRIIARGKYAGLSEELIVKELVL